MPAVCKNRLSIEERDRLLSYAWLSQQEFARVMEVDPVTIYRRIKRGDYKGLYIMVGASRKFDGKKVKRFLEQKGGVL